jgi:enoyl-CoA hydratase
VSDAVLVQDSGNGVVVITLNRPAARNAVNVDLANGLVEAVEQHQHARCLVITGADPAFCAGLDLRNLGTDNLADLPPFIHAVRSSAVPVVAAVNGPAVTGGFEIALSCDFIIASDRAAFADTHLRVGVYPGPVLVELPRRVGTALAREMSLTGNFIDATTALRVGLVNHVVPHPDLIPFTMSIAAAIAEQPVDMVRLLRADMDETSGLPVHDALRRHIEIARGAGLAGATDQTLRSNMASVVERARRRPTP